MSHRSTTRTQRRLGRASMLGAVLATALTLVAPAAWAGGYLKPGTSGETKQAPTWAAPAARMPVEGEEGEAIAAELHNAEQRVLEALQNAETADYQLTRARTRNYPRGEGLQTLKVQDQDARRERNAAANDFSALVERARREGVPMGTLSRYMDLDDRLKRERATWSQ